MRFTLHSSLDRTAFQTICTVSMMTTEFSDRSKRTRAPMAYVGLLVGLSFAKLNRPKDISCPWCKWHEAVHAVMLTFRSQASPVTPEVPVEAQRIRVLSYNVLGPRHGLTSKHAHCPKTVSSVLNHRPLEKRH